MRLVRKITALDIWDFLSFDRDSEVGVVGEVN